MASLNEDPTLAARFAELRRLVEPAAGSTQELLSRGVRGRRWRPSPWRLAAACAGLVLTAGALLLPAHRPVPPVDVKTAATLGSGHAATDFLLATPGAQLLGQSRPSLEDAAGSAAGAAREEDQP
jgi:hypothetical protein